MSPTVTSSWCAAVTPIAIEGASLASPAPLPVVVGTIPAKGSRAVYARFAGRSFAAGDTFAITLAGRFAGGDFTVVQRVRVPAAAPGSARALRSTAQPHVVKGARYPHAATKPPGDSNGRDDAPVPVGEYHEPGPPPRLTSVVPAKADPPPINFFHNDPVDTTSYELAEPSGDVANNVVFVSRNTVGAYSTDGGLHYTPVDPTTLFPPSDGGVCCDTLVKYVPAIDRFVWVIQYRPGQNAQGKAENLYRIASASPAAIQSSGGTSWTYWDITSLQLGDSFADLDYPDLALGDHFLYLSFVGHLGRVVTRIPLSQIVSPVPMNFAFSKDTDSPMVGRNHPTQNARDEVFWAGHTSNSSMRVFNWPESSSTYAWHDVSIGSWPNVDANVTSITPDNHDWLGYAHDTSISGAARRVVAGGKQPVNQIWFAWTGAKGANFVQPQVQWVALDRNNNFKLVAQHQIWNKSYAFAFPEIAVNASGDVGLSLAYGGNGHYENHVAGFWGDYIVYVTTSSSAGVDRYGDYLTIRPDATHPNRFDAFGYGVSKVGGNLKSDTHYAQFGRPGS